MSAQLVEWAMVPGTPEDNPTVARGLSGGAMPAAGAAGDMPTSDFASTAPYSPHGGGRPRQLQEGIDGVERFGGFLLHRQLGSGGMGTVYEAQQINPPRRVALKVIRGDAASAAAVRRFELESAVLARLQHPGIAAIYEAGAISVHAGAPPTPYFAMELIVGTTLDSYVMGAKLGLRERLELVATIADAVNHAHQRGVIHRDLKPANILVDRQGKAKVLDFGVARLTDGDLQTATMNTSAGQILGTIPYMSPEQASGDIAAIDTRSDIFALGVVLYEVLTGRLPRDVTGKSFIEALRLIREQDPELLGKIDRTLRGDVETIVAKALDRDRERRYQSAGELAEDIRRYLRDEPIQARPASTMYQLRKFAKRRRGLVIGAGAVVGTLVLGVIGTSIGMLRAIDAEGEQKLLAEKARLETAKAEAAGREEALARADAEAVNTVLISSIEAAAPGKGGRELKVVDMIDRAAKEIDTSFAGLPGRRVKLHDTYGRIYRALNLYEPSATHFESALAASKLVERARPEEVSGLALSAAQARMELGDYAAAARALAEARKTAGTSGGDGAIQLTFTLAFFEHNSGDYTGAEYHYRDAIAQQRARSATDPDLAFSLACLSRVLLDQGFIGSGHRTAEEAWSACEARGDVTPPTRAFVVMSRGYAAHAKGEWVRAAALYREARDIYLDAQKDATAATVRLAIMDLRGLFEDAPPGVDLGQGDDPTASAEAVRLSGMDRQPIISLRNRARILARLGRPGDALALVERARGISRRVGGEPLAMWEAHTDLVEAAIRVDHGEGARALTLTDGVIAAAMQQASLMLAAKERRAQVLAATGDWRAAHAWLALAKDRTAVLSAQAWPVLLAQLRGAQARSGTDGTDGTSGSGASVDSTEALLKGALGENDERIARTGGPASK